MIEVRKGNIDARDINNLILFMTGLVAIPNAMLCSYLVLVSLHVA